MGWKTIRAAASRHRESLLAASLVAMTAAWEGIELVAWDRPPGRSVVAPMALHVLQVLVVAGVALVVTLAWRARTRHEEALKRMMETLVMAQEEERRRIVYEVHDGLAQLIVSAKQHVETSRDLSARDPERATRELAKAAERLHGAVAETHRVLAALRPYAVDSLGLGEAIRRSLEETAQEAGWVTRFSDGLGNTRLSAAVETAAFRIAQETLANAARHAGSTAVEVELALRDEWLVIRVCDDGVGLLPAPTSAPRRGLGLAGMQERARRLGGICTIASAPGGGTCVSVELPVRGAASGRRRV